MTIPYIRRMRSYDTLIVRGRRGWSRVSVNKESTMSKVTYVSVPLSSLVFDKITSEDSKTHNYSISTPETPKLEVSQRFFTSIARKTGISKDKLDFFDPSDVVRRVVEKDGDMTVRLAVENDSMALGIMRQEDAYVPFETAMTLGRNNNAEKILYENGNVVVTMPISKGASGMSIGGEEFSRKMKLRMPIDGFANPEIMPTIIRLVCENGMTAEDDGLAAMIMLARNDDSAYTLNRALNSYNGDKAFTTMALRLEEAKSAMASAAELASVVHFCTQLNAHGMRNRATDLGGSAFRAAMSYGENVSKRMRRVITDATAYDVINMLTELETHYLTEARVKQHASALVNRMIVKGYDFEGSAEGSVASKVYPDRYFLQTA